MNSSTRWSEIFRANTVKGGRVETTLPPFHCMEGSGFGKLADLIFDLRLPEKQIIDLALGSCPGSIWRGLLKDFAGGVLASYLDEAQVLLRRDL